MSLKCWTIQYSRRETSLRKDYIVSNGVGRTTLWSEEWNTLVNDQMSGVTDGSPQMNTWPAAQMNTGPLG